MFANVTSVELSVPAASTPSVVLCAAASASSNSAFPADVRSYVAAVPDPVKWFRLLASDDKQAEDAI